MSNICNRPWRRLGHLLKITRIHLCHTKVFSDMQRYILNLKISAEGSLGRHTSLSARGNTVVKLMRSRGSKGLTLLVTLTSKGILKKGRQSYLENGLTETELPLLSSPLTAREAHKADEGGRTEAQSYSSVLFSRCKRLESCLWVHQVWTNPLKMYTVKSLPVCYGEKN